MIVYDIVHDELLVDKGVQQHSSQRIQPRYVYAGQSVCLFETSVKVVSIMVFLSKA